MSSRDETLQNFQAFTGLEDVGTCMSILDQHGWNILKAVNSVMPQEFPAAGSPPPGRFHASNTRRSNPAVEQTNDSTDGASAQHKPTPMSSSMINLTVHYHSNTYGIPLPLTGTIKDLKVRLKELTGLEFEDQRLTGLPAGITDEIPFYNRKFDRFKNTVILHSTQEYDAIVQPKPVEPPEEEDDRWTAREKMDFRYKRFRANRRKMASRQKVYYQVREREEVKKVEEVKKKVSPPPDSSDEEEEKEKENVKAVETDSDDDDEEGLKLKAVETDSDEEEEGQKVKGAESDSDDDEEEKEGKVKDSDSDSDEEEERKQKAEGEESESDDDDDEEEVKGAVCNCFSHDIEEGGEKEEGEGVGYQSDDGPEGFDEDMFVSLETVETKGPLIPPECEKPSEALQSFSTCFTSRYGEVHPLFYIGSLADAVKEATAVPADQRKPMFIYLHHDSSIMSNIFCSQLLCAESIVNYLSVHYIVWAWDLTTEDLKRKLLDMVKESFGVSVASNVDDISPDHLPIILIVFKSKGTMEVRDIVQGHTDPDNLLTTLIMANEQHQQQAESDLLEERERQHRDDMIRQQEIAYQDSLQADKEKERQRQLEEDIRLQRELEEQFERQKVEAAMKKKEEERQRMMNCIPPEPDRSCAEKVSTLRIRFPDGSMDQRRFLASCHTVRMLLSYVGSKGYLPSDHNILTSYPKRNINDIDLDLTLEEANLFPSETLHVEEES